MKTRNSRTKHRTEAYLKVEAPGSVEGQQNQLRNLVLERFPEAKFRVFHDGAASFTAEDLHIVAAYQGDAEVGFANRPAAKSGQDDDGFEQLPLTG